MLSKKVKRVEAKEAELEVAEQQLEERRSGVETLVAAAEAKVEDASKYHYIVVVFCPVIFAFRLL